MQHQFQESMQYQLLNEQKMLSESSSAGASILPLIFLKEMRILK